MKIVKSLRIELEESDVQKALTEYIERHDPSIAVTDIKFGNRTLNITVEGELRPENKVTHRVMPQNASESDEYAKSDSEYIQASAKTDTTDIAPEDATSNATESVRSAETSGVRDTEQPLADAPAAKENAPAKRPIFTLPDTVTKTEKKEDVQLTAKPNIFGAKN